MNEFQEYVIRKCEDEVRTQERVLQNEINQMMPSIKEKYEIEIKKLVQQRAVSLQGSAEKPEQLLRYPRCKFPWKDSLRYNSLFSILQKCGFFSIFNNFLLQIQCE